MNGQDHLNGHSALILAVFCIVSILVIAPVRIPLPGPLERSYLSLLRWCRIIDDEVYKSLSCRRVRFRLGLETAPVIAVILLLATTTIDGSTIKLGIKGDENVKPYDVLVLFISLAYISIALDGTGALEAVAFWVSKRGGNSGRLLFLYLYSFFLATACIVGNDPLILSGTPFLAYLTHHTGLEPTAWIFSEFMAANTASAVLVSSNPTNILIAGSFGLNFLTGFTKWTILPSIIPAILNYPLLYFLFRKKIPRNITPLTEDPWLKLRDPPGAIFLSILMLVTVAVLVGTSFVPNQKVEVWMVTAPAGIVAFLFNITSDWFRPKTQQQATEKRAADQAAELHHIRSNEPPAAIAESPQELAMEPKPIMSGTDPPPDTANDFNDLHRPATQDDQPSSNSSPHPTTPSKTPTSQPLTLTILHRLFAKRFPSTHLTLTRLPLPLLPFAMSFFILVRGLSQRGWIHVFARACARACTTPAQTVFFMAFVATCFLCPLAGTNIGATIILVEILRDPAFAASDAVRRDGRVLRGAVYAVAMGSNLGAFSYTFAGSLAGLLWRGLLADKGVRVRQGEFARVNALPLLMQTALAGALVLGELYWFG